MVLKIPQWRYYTYVCGEHSSNLKLSLQMIVLPSTRPLDSNSAEVLNVNGPESSGGGNSSYESPGTELYQ
jgi:hypothetical protein